MLPDKVDITVALHIASLVDACKVHRGCPLPQNPQSFPLCRQRFLHAAPTDAVVLAMLRSGHPPDPPLESLPGHPYREAPTKPYTDSTCTLCHSDVTSPEVPSSDRDLPWLHSINRLLLRPACGPGRHPVSHCRSGRLLLTSVWLRYHHCLDVLFADLWINPSSLASSCAPSTHLYPDFLRLLADPLGFEHPPLGIPVATRNRSWLDIIAATSCFLHYVCPTPSPPPPPLTSALACAAPSSVDSATTMDSLDCSQACVLLGSPSATPARVGTQTYS
jgi:hypothetical protein